MPPALILIEWLLVSGLKLIYCVWESNDASIELIYDPLLAGFSGETFGERWLSEYLMKSTKVFNSTFCRVSMSAI